MPLGATLTEERDGVEVTLYECSECHNRYDEMYSAEECCVHYCEHCDEGHLTQQEADACCQYQCGNCGNRWHTEQEANDCCRFQCEHCGEIYEYEADAITCCRPYQCPSCGSWHETRDEADECHQTGRYRTRYPKEVLERPVGYAIHIPSIEGRPSRLISLEQELSTGAPQVARMLHDLGYADTPDVHPYGRDTNPGRLIVKIDGTLDRQIGGEVVYSRFDLSDQSQLSRLSDAVWKIRELRREGLVTTETNAGMHVHVSAVCDGYPTFGPAQMASLYEITCFTEDVLMGIAAAGWPRHRGTSHAIVLPKYGKETSPGKVARVARVDRHHALNFARLLTAAQACRCGACLSGDWAECDCGALRDGTIEWRYFNTTTKPETVHAWILLSVAMTAKAFDHQLGTLDPNPWRETDLDKHPMIFGWMLNELPLMDYERQLIINVAKRSPGLGIDWKAFDAEWEPVEIPEVSMRVQAPGTYQPETRMDDRHWFADITRVRAFYGAVPASQIEARNNPVSGRGEFAPMMSWMEANALPPLRLRPSSSRFNWNSTTGSGG